MVLAVGVGIALSGGLGALANVVNGHYSRQQQRELHAIDSAAVKERFNADFGLRQAQFAFTQEEAQRARLTRLAERNEDFARLLQRDHAARASEHLKSTFNGTAEGLWLHDPFAASNPGLQSLRVFLQCPRDELTTNFTQIERIISAAARDYMQRASGYGIHFPTGVWKKDANPGSWVSTELHALNPQVPTLVLRLDDAQQAGYVVEADIFGFALGNQNFVPNIVFGFVPKDLQQINQALPLLTLATADIYHIYTYGKAPLLPYVLADLISPEQTTELAPAITGIVTAYRQTINALAHETPEVGLMTAVNLAGALTALPDKSHALAQIQQVEALAQPHYKAQPQLKTVISGLYTQAGAPQEAQRLLAAPPRTVKKPGNGDDGYSLLEKIL